MDYTGYKNLILDDTGMANFYTDLHYYTDGTYFAEKYGLVENEFLVIRDAKGASVDKYIYQNENLHEISYKVIKSALMGDIKPRNTEQELAFHMLQDPTSKIKVLTGRYGSGKSMAMIASALERLNKGEFDKIIYVRNNIGVRDTNDLGSLPGGEYEKLKPYLMVLADHLGGEDVLDQYIEEHRIEPIHLGYLRGRDLRNSLIYCTEAQNLSIDHMKLLIGRVGEGSELHLDGDFHAQVDRNVFEKSSGLKAIIDKLSGNPYFGYVHLVKSERSPISALADELDE